MHRAIKTASAVVALCAALIAGAAADAQPMGLPSAPLSPTDPPPPVTPPEEAMKDPIASDPIFWWRQESFLTQAMEPPASFYWPDGHVEGAPGPFLPAAQEGRTSIAPDTLKAMEAWADGHNSRALIVVHKGKVQLERYWRGVSADELTNSRAITRTFTPMMLGFAVAEGKVELDGPIGRYIPEWAGDARGKITVRQVAQNATGLEHNFPTYTVYGNKQTQIFYSSDVTRSALAMDRVIEPGTVFDVAEVNTQLIALIIERSTGKSFQDYMSERVWKPIGARGATYQLDRPGGTARVLCCMRTTPRDLARAGQLFLDDGQWRGRQVLPKGWVEAMATPSPLNKTFGMGLWLGQTNAPQSEPFLAPDVRMMMGGGYRTVYIVPSQDLVIVRLGYADPKWDNAYLVNTAIRGMRR